ncbi:MAG: hypothetical protein CSA58_10410 [Micrococcales bacterium]|nr:MAG: hypothetical protein CSB46_11355 [Micrococcales bacterium]PIE26262.1 MAG: hypothetical protein CSA58_10410 [Micrococcales bacterium]
MVAFIVVTLLPCLAPRVLKASARQRLLTQSVFLLSNIKAGSGVPVGHNTAQFAHREAESPTGARAGQEETVPSTRSAAATVTSSAVPGPGG